MATILFMPLSEKGHVITTLKLAKSLRGRGHRVLYVGLLDFQEYLSSHGFELIPLFEDLLPKGFIGEGIADGPVFQAVTATLHAEGLKCGKAAQAMLDEEIHSIVRRMAADLVVIDSYLAVLMPLTIKGIADRCILLNPTVRFALEGSPPEQDDSALAPLFQLPAFFLCPEDLDFPGATKLDHHYYAESCVDFSRTDVTFPLDWICADKQLVYCSLGTQSHWSFTGEDNEYNQKVRRRFLQNVIDSVALRPQSQLILSVGSHLRPEDFRADPSRVIVVQSAPQLDILRRASAVITHGGLNTIKESILFRVPLIVFPLQADQSGNAARVVYHHLGVRGHVESATATSIAELIGMVEPGSVFTRNLEQMSRIFRAKEEAELAIKFVEDVLRDKRRGREGRPALKALSPDLAQTGSL